MDFYVRSTLSAVLGNRTNNNNNKSNKNNNIVFILTEKSTKTYPVSRSSQSGDREK